MVIVSRSWIPGRIYKAGFLLICLTIIIIILLTNRLEKHCKCATERAPLKSLVDFRVLVLTHSRPDSLRQCLKRLNKLIVDDGTTSQLDIWIDRGKDNHFDGDTYRISKDFKWKNGVSMIHVHSKHVGVYGQWLDTWQPVLPGSGQGDDEIALFVEDDIDLSPYAYRWLKRVREFYTHREDIAMFCLQDINAVKMGAKGGEVSVQRRQDGCQGRRGECTTPSRWVPREER